MKRKTVAKSLIGLVISAAVSAQTNIDVKLDGIALSPNSILFNINQSENTKMHIKYVTFIKGCVKSDDESSMNGQALAANGNSIKGYIGHSNIAMVLSDYEIATDKKQIISRNNYLIAVRNVDFKKNYKYTTEESQSLINSGTIVPFNKSNIANIPGLSKDEVNLAQMVLQDFSDGKFKSQINSDERPKDFQELSKTFKQAFKSDEKYKNNIFLKYGDLSDSLSYQIGKDDRIKKEEGVTYNAYFIERKNTVKKDSVFFGDKSEVETPEPVFDIAKNSFQGFLLRLSCKSLIPEKEKNKNYFRYSDFDRKENPKHFQFQLETGKLNSIDPYRTFKLGDTLIHLTSKKTGFLQRNYESYILTEDTLMLKYPISNKDTISFVNVFCGNQIGSKSFFGQERKYFMNVSAGEYYFIGEQEMEAKFSAGLTKMDSPDANELGYSITKIYCLHKNAVEKVYKIRVPNFSKAPSEQTLISKSSTNSVYLVQMDFPVLFMFNSNGKLNLKNVAADGFTPKLELLSLKYTCTLNNDQYLILSSTDASLLRLVKLEF